MVMNPPTGDLIKDNYSMLVAFSKNWVSKSVLFKISYFKIKFGYIVVSNKVQLNHLE